LEVAKKSSSSLPAATKGQRENIGIERGKRPVLASEAGKDNSLNAQRHHSPIH
jgi:hypothetical protein